MNVREGQHPPVRLALREAPQLVHAVARIVLQPEIPSIQASWVKLGPEGVRACLSAGANDVGGTLMNESITRAAGAAHGQEFPPAELEVLIRAAGRERDAALPERGGRQRTVEGRLCSSGRDGSAGSAWGAAQLAGRG